jgi:hypothetical protein
MTAGRCWLGNLSLLQRADRSYCTVVRPVEGANAFRLARMLQNLRMDVGQEQTSAGIIGSACF